MSDIEKPSWEWRAQVERLELQLAETQAHLDTQRQATYQAVEREHAAKKQLTTLQAHVQEQQVEYAKNADTIQHVKQQLAAVTKEREEARDMAACLLFFGPTFPADVAWAEMQIAKMKHEKGLP